MMEIQLQLILTAYFVNSGWTMVQLHNSIADQAVTSNVDDAGSNQESTFNKMKEKLRTVQSRSENKNRNLHKRSNDDKDDGVYALASDWNGPRPDKKVGVKEKTAEQIEIESFAQEVKNKIEAMPDPYDRRAANDIHAMWFKKMLEVESGLRDSTAPLLTGEVVVDDSQVELFGLRVHRKINNWPDVDQPIAFEIHGIWYEWAKVTEKRLKEKYKRTPETVEAAASCKAN